MLINMPSNLWKFSGRFLQHIAKYTSGNLGEIHGIKNRDHKNFTAKYHG